MEETRKRNAVINALKNLTIKVRDLEARVVELEKAGDNSGWSAWAQKIIIILLAALLVVLGYKEALSFFG